MLTHNSLLAAATPVPLAASQGILPAVPYSWVWLVLGALILAALAAWWTWLALRKRHEAPPPPEPAPPTAQPEPVADPFATLRRETMEQLEHITEGLADGSLTARTAGQRLASVVREYVSRRGGTDIRSATLAELRSTPNGTVAAELIDEIYAIEFGAQAPGDTRAVLSVTNHVRELVTRW